MAAPAPSTYPLPWVLPPQLSHKQSFVILHGRGGNAEGFGPLLLLTEIPGFGTLRAAFPSARFIFPTASKRRARAFNRGTIHQWFDYWTLRTPEEHEEIQLEGLQETTRYLHGLLRAEIDAVGAKNVVIWGLSQGCAASLIAMLTWDGEPFAACVGMCGWLPFRKRMENVAQMAKDTDVKDDNPFASDDLETTNGNDAAKEVACYLSDELELPARSPLLAFKDIPVFLGHGKEDQKVPMDLGMGAATCLELLGATVDWRDYPGLGHWYSQGMLGDITRFLGTRLQTPD